MLDVAHRVDARADHVRDLRRGQVEHEAKREDARLRFGELVDAGSDACVGIESLFRATGPNLRLTQ